MWSLSLVMSECSLSGREQFLHCGLRKFRHRKSSIYRWYTQLDCCRFVYDTRDNESWLGRIMVECTLSITHCLRLNLQLYTIDLVRTCRISSFCTVAWQLARFQYWHDASRGPSVIVELLVCHEVTICDSVFSDIVASLMVLLPSSVKARGTWQWIKRWKFQATQQVQWGNAVYYVSWKFDP